MAREAARWAPHERERVNRSARLAGASKDFPRTRTDRILLPTSGQKPPTSHGTASARFELSAARRVGGLGDWRRASLVRGSRRGWNRLLADRRNEADDWLAETSI